LERYNVMTMLSSWSGLKTIRPYENPAFNKYGLSCFGLVKTNRLLGI
jgi:hypothetical protein